MYQYIEAEEGMVFDYANPLIFIDEDGIEHVQHLYVDHFYLNTESDRMDNYVQVKKGDINVSD